MKTPSAGAIPCPPRELYEATTMKNIKTIDQRGIADAVTKRITAPAQYIARPLVIWRADFRDGVQEGVLREVVKEYNKNKTDEEKRLFWLLDMTDENKPLRHYHAPSRLGFNVVLPATAHPDSIDKAIQKIGLDVPLVFFMPGEAVELSPIFEQYIFDPDFEQWAAMYAVHSEIMEFIRGDGDKAGITYRWYNRFNVGKDDRRGCDMPEAWLVAAVRLGFAKRFSRVQKLCDLTEKSFRSAFGEGISADVIDEFLKYLQHNG